MTSRSIRYFRDKKRFRKDWVVDLWSEKICKEIDRLVLKELLKAAKSGSIK